MAIIAPFRGLTYNFKKLGEISRLTAPPYDVINEREQEEYHNAHPNNVIRLILGKKKSGDSDSDNRYTRSALEMKKWEQEGILVRSERPAMYITAQDYDPGDGKGRRTRWGLITLVRIEEEDSRVILPHEKTFSAHKDDRLKLMRACSAQLSQVFGLYDGSDSIISGCIEEAGRAEPDVSFDFKDGTSHRMWIIEDRGFFKKVTDSMKDKLIFIADGHHRYETSRNFRNLMREKYGKGNGDKAYDYVVMYLADMNDKGLTILPTHRLIKEYKAFNKDEFLKKAGEYFAIEEMPVPEGAGWDRFLEFGRVLEERGRDNSAIGFYCHKSDRCHILSLLPGAMDGEEESLQPSLMKLDVIVLTRLILNNCLGFTKEDLDNDKLIRYVSNMAHSFELVES
ncbi:MAG: DUF1015 domain-containing protein, partial [Deltaproteobacteria bacterium]|nr:DUF1015 domain-containing protein [Deltaproteobacteria bacterium]